MFEATVHIGPVLGGLEAVKRFPSAKVFRDAKKPLRTDLREHGKQQTGPSGRWKPLASSTKERRARGGRRSRKLLGRLPGLFRVTSGKLFVRAESLAAWSIAHQKGRRVGHGARLPRRQFAYVSGKVVKEVRDRLNEALARAWEGR